MEYIRKGALLVSQVGTPWLFFVGSTAFTLFLIFFFTTHEVILFVVSLLLTTGIVGILKITTRVPRPHDAQKELVSYAFPSGHAAGIVFLMVYGIHFAFSYLPSKMSWILTILLAISAVVVSSSRALLNVHTIFQILVGICIGFFTPLLVLLYQYEIVLFFENTLATVF